MNYKVLLYRYQWLTLSTWREIAGVWRGVTISDSTRCPRSEKLTAHRSQHITEHMKGDMGENREKQEIGKPCSISDNFYTTEFQRTSGHHQQLFLVTLARVLKFKG